MTEAATSLAARAGQLRAAFDGKFAAPQRIDAAIKHDLLGIRIGAEPYAMRLAEIAGLFVDRRITGIPGSEAALLGVAGFRGSIVPVYSLAKLVGQTPALAPRWLVIAAAAPVALAFDLFEGHLRAAADGILPEQSAAPAHRYAPEFIRDAGIVRPVLRLASVVEALAAPGAPIDAAS